ncbi:O-methyltransferase [bacterium]|nr:O-methyltransferase [bacterium]
MSEVQWNEVESYIAGRIIGEDAALSGALDAVEAAGMPAISVAPPEGKLLHLLARMLGARRILEIGTLGGYSTIWLGRALPEDGRLISLEYEPRHAEVARANIERAGLSDRVEVRVGLALDLLPLVEADAGGPFDLVFIDADKASIPEYIRWSKLLTRRGSLIIVDNVVRGGRVTDSNSEDPSIVGTRAMFDLLAADPDLDSTAIQTVGSKGYDGMAFILVK